MPIFLQRYQCGVSAMGEKEILAWTTGTKQKKTGGNHTFFKDK